jgi:hypothetical protein
MADKSGGTAISDHGMPRIRLRRRVSHVALAKWDMSSETSAKHALGNFSVGGQPAPVGQSYAWHGPLFAKLTRTVRIGTALPGHGQVARVLAQANSQATCVRAACRSVASSLTPSEAPASSPPTWRPIAWIRRASGFKMSPSRRRNTARQIACATASTTMRGRLAPRLPTRWSRW